MQRWNRYGNPSFFFFFFLSVFCRLFVDGDRKIAVVFAVECLSRANLMGVFLV